MKICRVLVEDIKKRVKDMLEENGVEVVKFEIKNLRIEKNELKFDYVLDVEEE